MGLSSWGFDGEGGASGCRCPAAPYDGAEGAVDTSKLTIRLAVMLAVVEALVFVVFIGVIFAAFG